jgi:hypothetical protein
MPIIDIDSLPAIPARVILRRPGRAAVRAWPGGWCFLPDASPTMEVLDADGSVIDQLPVDVGVHRPPRPRLNADPTQGRVGAAGVDHAIVVNRAGEVTTIPHAAWNRHVGGDLAFDTSDAGRDRVWIVTPSTAVTGLMPQPPSGLVLLADAATGEVLDSLALDDDHPEGYTMFVAPGHGVVLNGAYGQDGSMTWCLRTDGARIEASSFGDTGVASGFDPESGEIMFMPHDDEDVELRAWWTGELTAQARGAEIFGSWDEQQGAELDEPDGFGYQGCVIDESRLVTLTYEDRPLVVDRRNGAALGLLEVDGEELDTTTIEQVAPRRLLCSSHDVTLIAVDPIS